MMLKPDAREALKNFKKHPFGRNQTGNVQSKSAKALFLVLCKRLQPGEDGMEQCQERFGWDQHFSRTTETI